MENGRAVNLADPPESGLSPARRVKGRNSLHSTVPSFTGNRAVEGISVLELAVGIEPTTPSLRVMCSAIEPR